MIMKRMSRETSFPDDGGISSGMKLEGVTDADVECYHQYDH